MTMPEAERERIRQYLVEQAGSKSIEELIARVEDGMQQLAAAARSIPAERFEEHPAGDEWCPMDCLAHVVSWNAWTATAVLHAALTGEVPAGEPPELARDRDALLKEQERSNASLYEHVRAADPGAFLDVRWEHPFFGMLNWREWLLFLRLHALDHARQLAGMREALGA
ncbi:MAG: hypothetical protein KatS3mg062_0461 [Tepidiforma sp.]|nr:MAG: hypothetical protein KatS3mg062_0461 [Tepidiforma sp.]